MRKALEPRRALALQHLPRLRKINSAANEGNAARFDWDRFPRAGRELAPFSSHAPSHAALVWPRTPHRVSPERHDSDAACRNLEIGIAKWRMRLPEVANGSRPARFIFPGTLAPRNRRPAQGAHSSKRTTDVSWRPSDTIARCCRLPLDSPHAVGLTFTINLTPSVARPDAARIVHRICPQGRWLREVAFEGTVAAAIAGSPAAAGAEDAQLELSRRRLPLQPRLRGPHRRTLPDQFGFNWGWHEGLAGGRRRRAYRLLPCSFPTS